MTPEEFQLLELLHRPARNAATFNAPRRRWTRGELSRALRLSSRKVRELIESLRNQGHAITSSAGRPGYLLADHAGAIPELRAAIDEFSRRALTTLRTRSAMKRALTRLLAEREGDGVRPVQGALFDEVLPRKGRAA